MRRVALVAILGWLGCKSQDGRLPYEGASSNQSLASTTAASASAPSEAAPLPTESTKSGSATSSSPPSPDTATPPSGMTRIQAGLFVMGAYGEGSNEEERPTHEAIVATFDLDTTEVTLEAYRQCQESGACKPPHVERPFCNARERDRNKHPVNCIDLDQAVAYCAFVGKRLPTEREWEYAASGGAEKREYSLGNEPPTEATYCYHHPFGSCEVGSFTPGAFGLLDMTGNVWEWTQSEYGPYPSRGKPDAIRRSGYYVYRGGSWSRRFPKWLRNRLRNRYHPDEWSASIGVRCARSVTPPHCPPETEWKDGECVRTSGTPLCEPNYAYDDAKRTCQPVKDPSANNRGIARVPQGSEGPTTAPPPDVPCCARTRTPEFDADCQKNWPKTPASYRFDGGKSFPERQPVLGAAGCVPRDMGRTWTSACCQG